MPKSGKRKGGTPEEEIEEAASRMRKHKEHLKSARNSERWKEFLDSIGIDVSIGKREEFFEKVRREIKPFREITEEWREWLKEKSYKVSMMEKEGATAETLVYSTGKETVAFRGSEGRFTKGERFKG